ncbi:hypothetical protein B0H34DRAFT_718561 [Crassisporium funariophilum]|nr:hypothetical protein B0H34DRAFT_718561 [Crassisporium funariophilum]
MDRPGQPPVRVTVVRKYGWSAEYPNPRSSAPADVPVLKVLIGHMDANADAALETASKNKDVLVPAVGASLLVFHSVSYTSARRRIAEQGIPDSVKYREIRIIEPEHRLEVVSINDSRTGAADYSSTMFCPIDLLDERLTHHIRDLPNLIYIGLHEPMSSVDFVRNQDLILSRSSCLIKASRHLQRITFTADFSLQIAEILHSASSHKGMRAIEVLMPTTFQLHPGSLALVEGGLISGLEHLYQLEDITLPIELVTPTLLFYLARMPNLHFLELTSSSNTASGRIFLAQFGGLDVRGTFGALRELHVGMTRAFDPDTHSALAEMFNFTVTIL